MENENKKPEELIIKSQLLINVIQYLLKKPMFEVMHLVKALETEPIPYIKQEVKPREPREYPEKEAKK